MWDSTIRFFTPRGSKSALSAANDGKRIPGACRRFLTQLRNNAETFVRVAIARKMEEPFRHRAGRGGFKAK
jgi:hypothetical protein